MTIIDIKTSHTHKKQASSAAILFHGLSGAPLEMDPLAQHLYHKGFDVFVPCLSGHNSSIEDLLTITSNKWLEDADRAFKEANSSGYESIIVGGLSFGSLLAIHIAEQYPTQINSLVLLSCPLKFRSILRENVLKILSFAPDNILDSLPTLNKTKREITNFEKPRFAYPRHSIGAAARLMQIRRTILKRLGQLSTPTILLQDPNDHHLSPTSPMILRQHTKTAVRVEWFPNGQHELTVGIAWNEVCKCVAEFLSRSLCQEK